MFGCNCVEAEINGTTCTDCVPNGWTAVSSSPDIFDISNLPFCSSNSYDGGGVINICASASDVESLSTEISGLVAGATYYIGFEAMNCFNNGELEIDIDGEVFVFAPGDAFEEYTICFEANSDEAIVTLTAVVGTSPATCIFIDFLPCDYLQTLNVPCSGTTAGLTIEQDGEICPGESYQFFATVTNPDGSETFSWTSSPIGGMDYLDDPTSPEPIVSFPFSEEFIGASYTYTLTMVNGCGTLVEEVELEINPSEIPDFDDAFLCEDSFIDDLPTVSDNLFFGTWDGPADFGNYADDFIELTFQLDSGQDNCLEAYTYSFFVQSSEEPEFSFALEFCNTDSTLFVFPTESDSGIRGEWEERDFFPYDENNFSNVFYPDEDDFPCVEEVVVDIIVFEVAEIIFSLPEIFCNDDQYEFPDTSMNGLSGTWTYPNLDLLDSFGLIQNYFVPDSIGCGGNYKHEFEFVEVNVEFMAGDPSVCGADDGFVSLMSTDTVEYSVDGLQWIPIGNFNDLGAGTYEFYHRLDTLNRCLDTTIVQLVNGSVPEVKSLNIIPSTDCVNSNASLEIEYDNIAPLEFSIDGGITWQDNNVFIDIAWGSYDLEIRLMGDISCINSYSFEVPNRLLPLFISLEEFGVSSCGRSDGSLAIEASGVNLEYSIDGGINWQVGNTFENLASDTYEVLVREVGTNNCELAVEGIVADSNILVAPTIEFTQPMSCQDADGSILILNGSASLAMEYSLNAGVTWQEQNIFDFLNAGTYTLNYRLVQTSQCFGTLSFELFSPNLPEIINIVTTDVSDCTSADGSLMILSNESGLEYSIDNGLTWSLDSAFLNLAAGIYNVVIRFQNFQDCKSEQVVIVADSNVLEAPIMELSQPMSCDYADGSILITNSNTVLAMEYSLDGGVTWQEQNIFDFLNAGTYTLNYRLVQNPQCFGTLSFELFSPGLPEIIDIVTTDVSDCSSADGSLMILSNESDLEYSIDNGLTWSLDSAFSNLAAGTYNVVIRFQDFIDCESIRVVSISAPELPAIDSVIAIDDTDCLVDNGSIELLSGLQNLEFSIDSGISWQEESTFDNLSLGDYEILIRLQSNEDCVITELVSLLSANIPILLDYSLIAVSDCSLSDGGLTIDASGNALLYSIDDGISWQATNVFSGLSEGEYTILVQDTEFENCIVDLTFDILSPSNPILSVLDFGNPSTCDSSAGYVIVIVENSQSLIEYSIDNGQTWQLDGEFDSLSEGTYSLQARLLNAPSCSSSESIDLVLQAEQLSGISINSLDPNCASEDGQLMISSFSIFELEYSIDGGGSFQDSEVFVGLAEGSYAIVVRHKDSSECSYNEEVVLVEMECPCSEYDLVASTTQANCDNSILGIAEVVLNQGETILWSNGETDLILTDLVEGWYSFAITYEAGQCVYEDSLFITEVDPLSLLLETFPADCLEASNGSVQAIDVEGGTGDYNYSIDEVNFQLTGDFFNLSPGDYLYLIEDDSNCQLVEEFVITLNTQVELYLPSIVEVNAGDQLFLNPLIDEMSIDSFYWSPIEGILNPGELVAELVPLENQEYILSIFYGEGCVETRSILINVIETELYFPNVLYHGENNNSRLFVQGSESFSGEIQNLSVYDRWGNLVYSMDNPELNNSNDGWDARNFEQGVYVYSIEYSNLGASEIVFRQLTVIR